MQETKKALFLWLFLDNFEQTRNKKEAKMKVTLRRKQLKDGRQSLLLTITTRANGDMRYLGLYLTGDKQSDKEKWQLAQNIRSKRELEAASGEFGFDESSNKKQTSMSSWNGLQRPSPKELAFTVNANGTYSNSQRKRFCDSAM
jgi:hypothetical protein